MEENGKDQHVLGYGGSATGSKVWCFPRTCHRGGRGSSLWKDEIKAIGTRVPRGIFGYAAVLILSSIGLYKGMEYNYCHPASVLPSAGHQSGADVNRRFSRYAGPTFVEFASTKSVLRSVKTDD